MTIKIALTNLMKYRKWTQAHLAEECGTKQSNLSQWLKNGTGMRLDNFMKMVDSMGFDIVLRERDAEKPVEFVVDETQAAPGDPWINPRKTQREAIV